MRPLLIASSTLLAIHSMIYGAGRGVTLIPVGEDNTVVLEYTRIATYLLMLGGMVMWRIHNKTAFWLLVSSILGRVFLEYHVSVARSMVEYWDSIPFTEILFSLIFYTLSFVLPACVMIDLSRCLTAKRPQESEEKLA
nr:putative integron gene cassette protein [uncultured bacterium]